MNNTNEIPRSTTGALILFKRCLTQDRENQEQGTSRLKTPPPEQRLCKTKLPAMQLHDRWARLPSSAAGNRRTFFGAEQNLTNFNTNSQQARWRRLPGNRGTTNWTHHRTTCQIRRFHIELLRTCAIRQLLPSGWC